MDEADSQGDDGVRAQDAEAGPGAQTVSVPCRLRRRSDCPLHSPGGNQFRRQYVSIKTPCHRVGTVYASGVPRIWSETHWFSRDALENLQMDRSMRRRINHYLSPGPGLYFE